MTDFDLNKLLNAGPSPKDKALVQVCKLFDHYARDPAAPGGASWAEALLLFLKLEETRRTLQPVEGLKMPPGSHMVYARFDAFMRELMGSPTGR